MIAGLPAYYCDGINATHGPKLHWTKSLIIERADLKIAAVVLKMTYAAFVSCYDNNHFKKPLLWFYHIIALLRFRTYRLSRLRQCISITYSSNFQRKTTQPYGVNMKQFKNYWTLQTQFLRETHIHLDYVRCGEQRSQLALTQITNWKNCLSKGQWLSQLDGDPNWASLHETFI